jgi:hypothetical protein
LPPREPVSVDGTERPPRRASEGFDRQHGSSASAVGQVLYRLIAVTDSVDVDPDFQHKIGVPTVVADRVSEAKSQFRGMKYLEWSR